MLDLVRVVLLLVHRTCVLLLTCFATQHPNYVPILPFRRVNKPMVLPLIHPVAPVGPTPVIRPPVFIAPRPKAIAESIHCVPMAKANKSIRQIVRVVLLVPQTCVLLPTCIATQHPNYVPLLPFRRVKKPMVLI